MTASVYERAQKRLRALVALLTISLLTSCQFATPPPAFPAGEGVLLVRLSGFRNDQGVAIASLFAGAKGFPEDVTAARASVSVPIRGGQAEVFFPAVPYGEYAVCILHDEDEDGEMASSLLGTPREGFGFSGQPDYRFGHPDFAKTRFLLISPHRDIEVVIRYETGRREHQESGQAGKTKGPAE